MIYIYGVQHCLEMEDGDKFKQLAYSTLPHGVGENIVTLYNPLFPFVLVDPDFLHSDWLTGVVHETMHHAFGP